MKEIKDNQTVGRRTRKRADEDSQYVSQEHQDTFRESDSIETHKKRKSKKIHHMVRKSQLKSKKEQEHSEFIAKEKSEQFASIGIKTGNLKPTVSKESGTKQSKKGAKDNRKLKCKPKNENQGKECGDFVSNSSENIGQQQNFNSHSDARQIATTRKVNSKTNIKKSTQSSQLVYYDTYYEDIFNVLRPLDDIEEEYLIFNKQKPVEYQALVQKAKGNSKEVPGKQ